MRFIWTFVKVVIALALAIPLAIIVLGVGFGILGALIGLAVLALKFAVLGVAAWGLFRLVRYLLGGSPPRRAPDASRQIYTAPHYDAAMRELDRELGEVPRR
jgi:hypothetical protein